MNKVIVTGGAGFIGSHTCVALVEAGFEPVILDNFSNAARDTPARIAEIVGRPVTCHELDCRSQPAMLEAFEREGDVHGVIHFAAFKSVGESQRKPLDYYDNNVSATAKLLMVMRDRGVHNFVFSSSCTVYGEPDALPVTEHAPIKPAESVYGRTKQICEAMIEDAVGSGQALRAIPLRYFNPIGAHPSAKIGELPTGVPDNLVPYITQTAAGIREKLTVFGDDYPTPDGSCVRDYIHVVDLARAHVRALQWLAEREESSLLEVFNVGTGRGTSVLEAIAAFERASGTKLPYTVGPRREGDVIETYADVQRSREELGWRAELSVEDAMRDAWRWQQTLSAD